MAIRLIVVPSLVAIAAILFLAKDAVGPALPPAEKKDVGGVCTSVTDCKKGLSCVSDCHPLKHRPSSDLII